MKTFANLLREHRIHLDRQKTTTLQVNIGKRCNQACHHCHVEAGPLRTENMNRATIERLLMLVEHDPHIDTVDITGGAPELNPHFRDFVVRLRQMNRTVIDRCNLTIFFEEGQEDTPPFLAYQHVQIMASLPCYEKNNVEAQRGKGTFHKSIDALQKLNALGYGIEDSGLILNLVYNPVGAYLPPPQASLEADYRIHLNKTFGIVFNHLLTITNMPIKRYAHTLKREGKLQDYMQLLIDHFNPQALEHVMCRSLLSIGWDGQIYDCDFNQMLDIPCKGQSRNIWDIECFSDIQQDIAIADHCFGCTAGSGSSCTGSLLPSKTSNIDEMQSI